jgi:hypothetical protein
MSQVQCPYCLARSEVSASKRASAYGNLFFGWLRDEDTSTQLLASRPRAYRRLEFRRWSNQKLPQAKPPYRTVIMAGSRR